MGALGSSPHQCFNRGNKIQKMRFLGHPTEYCEPIDESDDDDDDDEKSLMNMTSSSSKGLPHRSQSLVYDRSIAVLFITTYYSRLFVICSVYHQKYFLFVCSTLQFITTYYYLSLFVICICICTCRVLICLSPQTIFLCLLFANLL